MSIRTLPWHRCKPGESFFVPTLKPWYLAEQGVIQGKKILGAKTPIRYRVGVYKKQLGVLFTIAAHQTEASDMPPQ